MPGRTPRTLSLALAGLVAGSLWLWGAGCDFERVNAGGGPALAEILAALAAADTGPRAEAAIGLLQEKVRSQFALPELAGANRAALAAKLAAFNTRPGAQAASVGAVYAKTASAWPPVPIEPIDLEAEDAEPEPEDDLGLILATFQHLAEDALAEPEDPYNAFLLTIAAQGPALPARMEGFGKTRALSPVQAYLFETWLRSEFDPTEEYAESASKNYPCKAFPCGKKNKKGHYKKERGQYKFLICHKDKRTLCLRSSSVKAHLKQNHGDYCGPCHEQGGGQTR